MTKIAIIGAGMGGLATAIRLAAAGHEVDVYEKNERVGGKLNILEKDGFRWDTGPSLITMPFVYSELWASAERNFDDYVNLLPVNPICRYRWQDGAHLDASDSTSQMVAEIERLEPDDVAAYFKFLAYTRKLYNLTADAFLFNGINSWRDFLRLKPHVAFQIDPFRTVQQALEARFKSPHLQQLFGRYATYNGSSPYLAPATLNIISYVEMGLGGYYVQGGLYKLAEAYLQLARELGVRVHTGADCGVAEILLQGKHVRGLKLTSGETVSASRVVANTDVTYTYNNLINPRSNNRKSKIVNLKSLEPSCSGFVLFLGVNKQYESLAHHNIFFSRDYKAEFDQIFKDLTPPDDPTIYVCWTGRTDADHAPDGKSNLFVLVNAPYLSPRYDWNAPGVAQQYRDLVVRRMEEHGLTDLSHHIESETIMTPADLQNFYNADRGAIYGVSSNNRFSAFLRPPNRSRRYKGLYFVGGSTHPGGGVPLVTLSARIVSELIKNDLATAKR
jgi:phytoene desaturase